MTRSDLPAARIVVLARRRTEAENRIRENRRAIRALDREARRLEGFGRSGRALRIVIVVGLLGAIAAGLGAEIHRAVAEDRFTPEHQAKLRREAISGSYFGEAGR